MLPARAVLTAVVVATSPSLAAAPCAGFDDVSDSDPFCVYVEWMKNRNITLGTTPTTYTPESPVTRMQMAAFMYRLGFQNTFLQGGNEFGGTAFLGTMDNHSVFMLVDGKAALRLWRHPISPNVTAGHQQNFPVDFVWGATIGGGGATPLTDPDHSNAHVHRVTDNYGTIGGGLGNVVGDDDPNPTNSAGATVAGGSNNTASARNSAVGGGIGNEATGNSSVIAGGNVNSAQGRFATVGGGNGNHANGDWSTVPGGAGNVASGNYSVALGHRARAAFDGDFVFADSQNFDFAPNGPDNFRVRATGGVRFVVDIDGTGTSTWSCGLVSGGSWVCSSDVNQKQDLQRLDGQAVLDKLAAMPVYAWSPRGRNAHVRHYGPTAQDFHTAFGLGEDDLGIGQQDADGVALAAIQGLNAKVEAERAAKDAEIAALRAELVELRALRAEVAALRATSR